MEGAEWRILNAWRSCGLSPWGQHTTAGIVVLYIVLHVCHHWRSSLLAESLSRWNPKRVVKLEAAWPRTFVEVPDESVPQESRGLPYAVRRRSPLVLSALVGRALHGRARRLLIRRTVLMYQAVGEPDGKNRAVVSGPDWKEINR